MKMINNNEKNLHYCFGNPTIKKHVKNKNWWQIGGKQHFLFFENANKPLK